jgi:hypothetical protein
MRINHRIARILFACAVGMLVAVAAHRWITDPARRQERMQEHAAVVSARTELRFTVDAVELEIIDPLAPSRKVGKAFVYRRDDGWQVSGYYRRSPGDRWHPFLMSLDAGHGMTHLRVRDPGVEARPDTVPVIEVLP